MYGIGNSCYNYGQLYSPMFGMHTSSCWNPWNSMVPNYAQMNSAMLAKSMVSNYFKLKDQMVSAIGYEIASREFNSEFNSAFSRLKSASSALKSFSSDSVFHPMGYESSNPDVAGVTQNTAVVTAPIHLEVTQTAASESYASEALASDGNALQGQHTLTITGSDGSTASVNVEFDSSADNKTNLNKMAAALNERDLGITASVSEADGRSKLVFSSDKTGTENAFTAELTGESAGTVGLAESQQARDAKYTVNGGGEQTSQSNQIELLDGDLGVTLKGIGAADLKRKTADDAQTLEAVKEFADSYNQVLSFLNKYKGKSTSLSDLAYSFSTTRFREGALSSIGINVDGKGALSVNERRFKDALRNNREDVERMLGGAGGLAHTAYAKTVSASIRQGSQSLYPKPPSLSYSNYMYGRDRNYVSSYLSGLFFNSLV